MLDISLLYEDELRLNFSKMAFKEKYKYYFDSSYQDKFVVSDSSWPKHEFVSLDPEGKVIGYIQYRIERDAYIALGLCIVNFSEKAEDKLIFGKDFAICIKNIFLKYRFNKLKFSVVVGNPIEDTYDRLINRHGGRIVGVFEKDTKLFDGLYYDTKCYEILRENFK